MQNSWLFCHNPGEPISSLQRFDDGPGRVTFTHIVHAYVDHATPLNTAVQKITFKTLQTAARTAEPKIATRCVCVTFPDEGHLIPQHCIAAPELRRKITDVATFRVPRALPLLFDVLDLGICAGRGSPSVGAEEFIVFTNSDIHVQPYFYLTLARLIEMGYDVITVNRRTISGYTATLDDLPLMLAEGGLDHPGYDCFVFPRRLCDRFVKNNACVGAGYVMRSLLFNLAISANRFALLSTPHLTFHIGDDAVWRDERYEDYRLFNKAQARHVAVALAQDLGNASRLKEFMQRIGEESALIAAVEPPVGEPDPSTSQIDRRADVRRSPRARFANLVKSRMGLG